MKVLRVEWHVVPPSDELTERNGSAILTVARSLRSAAKDRGVESYIVGGRRQICDIEGGRQVVDAGYDPFHLLTLFSVACSVPPRLLGAAPELHFNRTETPTHLFIHNQPWLGSFFREMFPKAHISLYLHNVALRGVPEFVSRKVYRSFDEVVCVSRYVASTLKNLGIPIRVVHNGVELARFPIAPLEVAYDICYVGRLAENKGLHVLLSALNQLERVGLRLRLIVVGGAWFHAQTSISKYERRVRRYATDRGLNVQFTGPVEPGRVPALLNSSLIAVVPSLWQDPMPLAALEGLASSAALICSRVGGIPEVVEDGARLVDAGNDQELAAVIQQLIESEATRRSLAEEGRAVAKGLTWSSAYEELVR